MKAMVEGWKPLPASAYKEDFRLRKQVLPPTYKSTPVRAAHHVRKPLPRSRAKFTNVEKILWPAERYTKADVITYYDAVRDVIFCLTCAAGRSSWNDIPTASPNRISSRKTPCPSTHRTGCCPTFMRFTPRRFDGMCVTSSPMTETFSSTWPIKCISMPCRTAAVRR